MRDLGERVRLVHELRELARTEVLLHHCGDWLRIDEVVRHERLNFLRHAHALFDRALHADQTDAVLVLHELADGAYATIAKVIDVVDRTTAVLELDEPANRLKDVLVREHRVIQRRTFVFLVELVVQLQAADLR